MLRSFLIVNADNNSACLTCDIGHLRCITKSPTKYPTPTVEIDERWSIWFYILWRKNHRMKISSWACEVCVALDDISRHRACKTKPIRGICSHLLERWVFDMKFSIFEDFKPCNCLGVHSHAGILNLQVEVNPAYRALCWIIQHMQLRLGAIPADSAVRALGLSTFINTIGNGLFMTIDVIYFTTIVGLYPAHVS